MTLVACSELDTHRPRLDLDGRWEFLDAADELGYLVCQEMPFGLSGERGRPGSIRPDG